MLLEFAVSNYKCFTDEVIFKMTPAPKIQDLKYSVLEAKHDENIRALSSAVVYGPNASGKTNLFGAMEVLKTIVKRGHIRNEERNNLPNFAAFDLELIPNYKDNKGSPVNFRIKFLCDNLLIEYSLSIFLGKFMEREADRKIISEKLLINDKMIFDRNDVLSIGNIDSINNFITNYSDRKAFDTFAKSNLNKEDLYLSTNFKSVFSNILASKILNWFENNFIIVYRADLLRTFPKLDNPITKDEAAVDEELNTAIKEFGFTGDFLAYKNNENTNETRKLTVIKGIDKTLALRPDVFESYGTVRFLNIFPLLKEALLKGQTLVIDEFDASIHPMALMSIINIFHNDEINKNNAQLIFNTHNPIFLNRNLFRRDEIKFVEQDEDTEIYNHYSLSDFGTSGEGGVRNTENYMNNYFISKYGAIKDIDFSPIFKKIMDNKENPDD